jgi:DNA-binding LacI/PurR family transcriptional regulator
VPRHRRSSERPTLADVARESGFSISTVSIVLNDAPLSQSVSDGTKQRIRAAALALGYRPDAFARSLRSRRSQIIGIMVFNIADPFCTLILKGIHRALQPTSYLPIIMDAQNEVMQFERYLGMLLERRVEGLIVVANWLFVNIKPLAIIEQEKIPTVLIGQKMYSGSMSSVMVDNERGGYLALQHLYDLGHREIAVLRGPVALPDSKKRWAGIARFAAENGIKLRKSAVVDLPNSSDPSAGFEEGRRIMSDLKARNPTITGVIAFDDLTALGAISALRHMGHAVPDNCSIVGFDDIPMASFSTPALTTIRQPMEQMGMTATDRLLEGIEAVHAGQTLPARHWLTEPLLVARESTAPLVLEFLAL